ncbi:MAG: KOW domain-containing RNA-binding protein [Eubacteriales bacterium]|nr:KOW domain-containing RNA-binding protein [Eubacteriales bacterium]
MNINVGDIVKSKAGRDAGRYFAVWEIQDDSYVTIVDGDLRKLENPKKKKVKHLAGTEVRLEELLVRKGRSTRILNSDIWNAIKLYEERKEAKKGEV